MENFVNQTTSAKDEYVEKPKAQSDKLNALIEELAAKATKTDADDETKRKHKELFASHHRKPDENRAKQTEIEAAAADDHLMGWFSMNWRN